MTPRTAAGLPQDSTLWWAQQKYFTPPKTGQAEDRSVAWHAVEHAPEFSESDRGNQDQIRGTRDNRRISLLRHF